MTTDTVPLSVKWGKETINLDKFVVAGGVKGLKTELEEKTRVPADRMKLMAKSKGLWKGVLKDDFDFSTIDFAAAVSKSKGAPLNLLLMGSAAELTGPKTKTVFLEDLPPEEVAKVKEPSGLENLGNTCYLNSVTQCLRATPQLRLALNAYNPTTTSAQTLLLSSLRDTLNQLDRTSEPVPPSALVRSTKMAFPEFARTGPNGAPMQQDAEEFFSGLLAIAAGELKEDRQIKAALPFVSHEEMGGATNLVDALFGLKMEETLTCDEFGDAGNSGDNKMQVDGDKDNETKTFIEPPVKSFDLHRKLVCNIQGGSDGAAQTNVSHLAEGISLSLNGTIEKRSEVLGRDATWTRKQRIARLPPILAVQFGRFYWKATPDSQDHAGVKCKVMKPVAFNSTFDVFEFCSDEVKKELKKSRDKALREEEDRINKKLKGESEEETEESMDVEDDEEAAALKAALAMSVQDVEDKPFPVGPGLPPEFQGHYELFALVTHKGRDADGGHYMAWVKASNNSGKVEKIADTDEDNEDWFVFDDDEVSPCKTEDVLKLNGGGDWHMSYINFYRAKK
ncbi:ubiquitin carboxyl-terminal hydrolase [Nitzschia inconspicua]|uniref:ubiquitinyl hydrolase 1 n=1 Tax=Nitzschia inconspicua TaxID=303405 RepID=A0A9K3LMD3_9STRA|nr:ubiquitin carboxyl-terminal hydrolase [Nitzschia inconspicua]